MQSIMNQQQEAHFEHPSLLSSGSSSVAEGIIQKVETNLTPQQHSPAMMVMMAFFWSLLAFGLAYLFHRLRNHYKATKKYVALEQRLQQTTMQVTAKDLFQWTRQQRLPGKPTRTASFKEQSLEEIELGDTASSSGPRRRSTGAAESGGSAGTTAPPLMARAGTEEEDDSGAETNSDPEMNGSHHSGTTNGNRRSSRLLQLSKHKHNGRGRLVPSVCALCLGSYKAGDLVSWSNDLSTNESGSTSSCPHAYHTSCIQQYAEYYAQEAQELQSLMANKSNHAGDEEAGLQKPLRSSSPPIGGDLSPM